jgi:hypothetical protein
MDERCFTAMAELRWQRDQVHRALLDRQKANRAELVDRQERGLTSPHLWAERDLVPGTTFRGPEEEAARRMRRAEPGTGLHWTERQGMVAQQRSAMRWLDRANERLNREALPRGPEPPSRLAAAAERLNRKETGKREASLGVEPDGPGGFG